MTVSNTTGSDPSSSSLTSSSPTVVEIQETIDRIRSQKGVEHVLIMDQRGAVLQSTLDQEQSANHARILAEITAKASCYITEIPRATTTGNGQVLPDNQGQSTQEELTFLRIRSKQQEIMVSPYKEFILVVIQNIQVANK